jgi:4-hydroxybenzoate polyprenyltransferase
VVALVLACHPVPTVAVTVMATVLVVSAGNNSPTVLVGAAAVLTGQLSIGWSNDLIDVRRDAAAGRQDKPLAAGAVSARAVAAATALALALTVALSMALGWRAGAAQLCVVTGGWVYSYPLKSTRLSAAPFFVAFGALPAVATLALPEPAWPPVWVLVAAGLIGVSAHFGNVLPDFDDDAATGVRGLPHRIGRFGSAVAASLCAVTASVIAVVGSRPPWAWGAVALVVAVGLAGGGLVVVRRQRSSEAAFYTSMAVAAIGVTLIAVTGSLANG